MNNRHFYFTYLGQEMVGELFGYYFAVDKRVYEVRDCEDIEPVPSRRELHSLTDITNPIFEHTLRTA